MKDKVSTAFLVLFVTVSCVKREHGRLNEPAAEAGHDLITTVCLVATDSSSGVSRTYKFSDTDGPGGAGAIYGPGDLSQSDSVIVLAAGRTYSMELFFINESVIPSDTVSEEVRQEGEDHLVYFDEGVATPFTSTHPFTTVLGDGMQIIYDDTDADSHGGVGLHTIWRTQGTSKARLRITLKHQPGGKGTFDNGETDLQVWFKREVR